jgi:structural maintenance of chromosome 1
MGRSGQVSPSRHPQSQVKFRSFAKGARLVVDVIQFEPAVERAMHHACGNPLVCDTMEVAKFVTWEKGQEVKG